MADRTESLVLQMSADIRKMEKALNQARGTTNRQLGQIEQRFDQMNAKIRRAGDSLGSDLRRSIAAIGAGLAVRELVNAADQWTNLRNQVKQYSDVVGPVGDATDKLTAIANEAGVAVGSLGGTFAASARAARTLKASSADVFAFNEAVAKGAAIANTGVAAVDGALVQLAQSIGSPKARLQEFNSVVLGTPRLAQAFADGIAKAGGSVAKLRELIEKGSISGGDLFQALISQLPKLRTEFGQTEATVSRSLTRLQNAFIQYVGKANTAAGATATLGGFIDEIAKNFDTLADAAIVAATVLGGTLAAGAIIRLVGALTEMIAAARTAATAMEALKVATLFFTGPTGGVILAMGAALAVLGLNAVQAKRGLAQVEDTLNRLATVQGQIKSDTDRLTAANKILQQAIAGQGDISEEVARRDVESIQKRINANKQLAEAYKVLARDQLAQIQNDPERARLRLAIATQGGRAFPGVNLGGVNFGPLRDAIRAVPAGKLTDAQQEVLNMLAQLDTFEAKVEIARDRLKQLGDMENIVASGGGVGGAGGFEAATSELNRFLVPLEKFNDALLKIRASKEIDFNKSRATVQALLDYAQAMRDVGAAEALIPSVQDVLADGDWGLLHGELGKLKREFDELPTAQQIIADLSNQVSADDLAPKQEFEDETKTLKEGVRSAVKEGLRSGITDDNWGQALRKTMADALVAGFDEAIDHLADLLTNFLFGVNGRGGIADALVSAGLSAFGFSTSSVGSSLTTAAVNGMTASRSAQGVTINSPLIVQGSIEAATMPQVQQALAQNNRAIMSMVPTVIDARVADGRLRGRPGYK